MLQSGLERRESEVVELVRILAAIVVSHIAKDHQVVVLRQAKKHCSSAVGRSVRPREAC